RAAMRRVPRVSEPPQRTGAADSPADMYPAAPRTTPLAVTGEGQGGSADAGQVRRTGRAPITRHGTTCMLRQLRGPAGAIGPELWRISPAPGTPDCRGGARGGRRARAP